MSEDVRKNLRTQGRYNDGKVQKSREKKQKHSPTVKDSSETRFSNRNSGGNKSMNNSLTDENVPSVKYEENSDYSFEQLEKVAKPEEIKGRGEMVLSETSFGKSKIFFEPRFLHDDEGNEYFQRLYDTINWDTRNIVIHGIEYPQPRLVSWFGPFPYSYSGSTLAPAEMPDVVMEIKNRVEKYLASNGTKATFNSVLINLYRDGKDSVAWHSDDELMLGFCPTIASVSLGEVRRFEMRPKMRNYDDQSPSSQTSKYFVHLTHGSLIVMTGAMQDDWQHRVPKEYHDKEPRINLTFRTVYPVEKAPEYGPGKEISPKTGKKQSYIRNSSSKTSNSEYKLDDEHFPSLQKDVISAKSNVTCDNSKYLNPNFKKDTTTEECWDSEISDNVQNESVVSHKNTFAIFDKRDEDYKPKINGKNNFNNEKPSEMRHNIESKCDNVEIACDDKTATKKLWCNKYDLSVNDFQENNTIGERCDKKCHKSVKKSSANEIQGNQLYKGIDKNVYDRETSLTVISQQNALSQEECSVKVCNIKTNSYVNATQENDVDNEVPSNTCHYLKGHSWVESSEESNLDMKKTAKMALNADVKTFNNSYIHVTQQNDLDNEKPPNTRRVEGISWVSSSEENNLELKKPIKTQLNADAKEFIPINRKSNEVSQFSELKLENLINFDINSLQGRLLQDHAQNLKKQVSERLQEMVRFDRSDLEFLLELTDGSQTDKNQRLISIRICKIVQNSFQRNRQPPNVLSPPERSSRQRCYESQSYYVDKGKRYPNQSRNSKSNRGRF